MKSIPYCSKGLLRKEQGWVKIAVRAFQEGDDFGVFKKETHESRRWLLLLGIPLIRERKRDLRNRRRSLHLGGGAPFKG